MSNQQVPQQLIAVIFYVSGILAVFVAVQAMQSRQGSVWRYFVYTMGTVALWCFSDALFFSPGSDDSVRWLWTTVGYSASVMSVPVIFAFSLYFARLDHWLTPQAWLLLWTPFLLAVLLAVTNRWHGLIWDRAISPLQLTGAAGHGAYFYVMLLVSYGLSLAAAIIFLQSFWRLHHLYQRQAIVLSVAVLLPLFSSILYFTDLNPFPGVDLAPAIFVVTGILLLYGMVHLHLMDLRPVYRDEVFKHMSEGAMVLDATGRIVDVNPAAQELLTQGGQVLGDDAQLALAHSFALEGALDLSPGTHHLLATSETPPRTFDLRVAQIDEQPATVLLIWRDITRLRAALATIYEQEYLIAARVRAETELKHDIEQMVVALKSQVQSALNHLEQGRLGATAAILAEVDTVTAENLLRRTQTFYVSSMQAIDFLTAIQEYILRFAELHRLEATLFFAPDLDPAQLAPVTRLHMVRILQASLENVGAHAQARQVEVRLEHTREGSLMTVRDDGCGFEPASVCTDAPSGGIAGMQQRMQLVNGSLAITSMPGAGVEVRALFPDDPLAAALVTLRNRRVFLAVEHPLTREGVRAMLLDRGMVVDVVTSGCASLLATTSTLRPDLVILDIDLPGVEKPATIQHIRAVWPAVRVVMLSEESHPNLPVAFHNGADGFVLKSMPADTFFQTLAQILGGENVLTPGMATQVLAEFRHETAGALQPKDLTTRQVEILQGIGQGMTYDEIADRLHLSARTVRYHVEQIRRRLGLANRSEVARYARRHHLGDL